MPLEYFDYRTDLRNVFISPELRSRFMKIKAGTTTGSHTHDLGHEVFLVLEGEIEFDVAGQKAVLGPGQMCIARVDEPHTLRVIGDKDATIYLSVTPHVEPTHTQWESPERKARPRYGVVDDGWEHVPATPDLVRQQVAVVKTLAETAAASARAHEEAGAALEAALTAGDAAAARDAVDRMWEHVSLTYQGASKLAEVWNQLAPRATH
jgi:quercetin dioxygenase-like cupin family protein